MPGRRKTSAAASGSEGGRLRELKSLSCYLFARRSKTSAAHSGPAGGRLLKLSPLPCFPPPLSNRLQTRCTIAALPIFFALVLLLGAGLALPVHAALEDPQTPDSYYARFRGQGASINVYNWGEYIADGSDGMMNINKEFEELTGIKVYYSTFATNEELYSKLRGAGASYDIVIPSDYMIGKMITEDMLLPLDADNIPNRRFIGEQYQNALYDPENRFSVPYTWGYVGIIYNKNAVDPEEVATWEILWDEKYLGEILMFSNPRDAFAIAQAKLGYSLNTTNPEELADCLAELKKQKPLVQAYVMDEIFDKMLGGEAVLAPYYAGDAVTMMGENEDLGFAAPREGTNIFVDAVCIPRGAGNKEAAEMYINFLCEPEVAAANSEYIGYATPNTAALDILDEEITGNPVAYPDAAVLQNTEYFGELPREASLLMDSMWTELLSSDENYSRLLVPVLLMGAIAVSVAINISRMFRKKKQKRYF